jgi:outer membrane protein OmpA-like peptidoglycan-associated protein
MLRNFKMTLSQMLRGVAFAALLCVSVNTYAQKADNSQDSIVDVADLSIEETLMIPEVPNKQSSYIKNYMHREAQALQKMGFTVESMRKGEVVIATIPADKLFAPNDTTLLTTASQQLSPFLPYFRTHGKFKVVLAMHSDDTGSEEYLYGLTERRIVALYDYFDSHATQTDMLQGYPMADSDPLPHQSNETASGRKANRRLEIYIVPGPILIMEAKSKNV